jgi:hypothetical protein
MTLGRLVRVARVRSSDLRTAGFDAVDDPGTHSHSMVPGGFDVMS